MNEPKINKLVIEATLLSIHSIDIYYFSLRLNRLK